MVDTTPLRPKRFNDIVQPANLRSGGGCPGRPHSCARRLRHNVDVRNVLIRLGATAVAILVLAAVVDFGTAAFAEYRFARSVRVSAQLNWDPSVAILGFPFITQAMNRRYSEVEVRAVDVEHPVVGRTSVEATMHGIDLSSASWLIRPDATMPVDKLESRIIIDSAHLGRYMGITDLIVEAPSRDLNDGADETTESGISESHGLVFTGTPKAADFDKRVSVSVDLSITGADRTTLKLTPTAVLTGPGTAGQSVPEDKQQAVLDAFRSTLPDQKLPFGVAPTSQGARGSDVIIEGITEGVTIALTGFRQS